MAAWGKASKACHETIKACEIYLEKRRHTLDNVLTRFAVNYNIDEKLLSAITRIETKNGGISVYTKLPIIRFELHIFDNMISPEERQRTFHVFAYGENKTFNHYIGPTSVHLNQDTEWESFFLARLINTEAAMLSTSYGFAQIMGFNYDLIGYRDVYTMYLHSYDGDEQYDMFFSYLKNKPGLLQALRDKNLEQIALLYNGPANITTYVNQLKKYL